VFFSIFISINFYLAMFDIWKRGVHPFDFLREQTALLPNTPTSMLVRSNSLNSMGPQPRDVIDSFIKACVNGGINVFTNFDAHNDVRNHVAVAEAVHKYGQHYQAALSWAVFHQDPTIYNVQWAVNWFKTIVKNLSPHSLYVKDPSGVLTPEMAGILAREIKAEFPNLPLIFHTHYQVS
jgi:oxaloacetate decarboxylase alpha subunit